MGTSDQFLLLKTTTDTKDEFVLMEQQDKLEDTQAALVAHLDKELGEDLFEWRTGYKVFSGYLRLPRRSPR